jgi:hypothetical protein
MVQRHSSLWVVSNGIGESVLLTALYVYIRVEAQPIAFLMRLSIGIDRRVVIDNLWSQVLLEDRTHGHL